MVFPTKPLGHIKQGLAELGHDISYAYDDLIFPSHTAYLIQFGKENYEIIIYFSNDCPAGEVLSLKEELTSLFAGSMGFSIDYGGTYSLSSRNGSEEMDIEFFS